MIFEQITSMENLEKAWSRVKANRAAPGIDRVTWQEFEKDLAGNLNILKNQLKSDKYRPLPIILYNQKKRSIKGPGRAVGISSVRDKIVQQAILMVIAPYFEKSFLPCSYAYRPKKSALSAIANAGTLIKKGYLWALQLDVEHFFDSMDHDILLALMGRVLNEKPLISLVSKLLKAKIFKEMGLFDTAAGSQQGSGLSPFLSNIYMHPADIFLWKKYKDRYLRYSDDITVFGREKDELEQSKQLTIRCLAELKLTVNERKTMISHVSDGIIYLGYYMDIKGKGPAQKSVNQIQNRLQAFHNIRKTDDLSEKLKEICVILRGWYNYYKTLKPITPPNILSLITLVKLADEFKETGHAKELLKKSSDFSHSNPQICYELGELFSGAGMQNQAMREYAKAIELDPSMEMAKEKVRVLQEGEKDVYKAIEKLQLVLHHNPEYREGYLKLAHYYTQLGLFGFAEKAHQKALEIDDDLDVVGSNISDKIIRKEHDFDYHTIDQEVFLSIFTGRRNAHAKQWIDERGRWGFMRVDRSLKKKDVYKHLKGEVTLGIYPVTELDAVHFIVFDVDTAKRKILESKAGNPDEFRIQSHKDICRIKTVCEQMSLKLYLEDSGYKGRHGWLFFSDDVKADRALRLGQEIMEKAGGPSKNMIWELFPMGKSDRHNSIIKLPLGINLKNNRRCLFLTDENLPVSDQGIYLRTIAKNNVSQIENLFERWDKEDFQTDTQIYSTDLNISSGLKKMINECKIINHMISKAKDTNYLNHFERMCLLYTLTFAGEEGEKFLHKVMGYCINYDIHITQRHIERRKKSPISCAKIAEYFPDLAETMPCDCKFDLPPRGYPSPVLYLLESELEYAGFNASKQENLREMNKKNDKSKINDQESDKLLDFEKIFQSEYIEENKEEKSQPIPDENETVHFEALKINNGSFFSNGMTNDIRFGTGTDPKQKDVIPDSNNKNDEIEPCPFQAWDLGLEYMRLMHKKAKTLADLKSINDQLTTIFEEAGTDNIETASGIIKREQDQDGNVTWILIGKAQ